MNKDKKSNENKRGEMKFSVGAQPVGDRIAVQVEYYEPAENGRDQNARLTLWIPYRETDSYAALRQSAEAEANEFLKRALLVHDAQNRRR